MLSETRRGSREYFKERERGQLCKGRAAMKEWEGGIIRCKIMRLGLGIKVQREKGACLCKINTIDLIVRGGMGREARKFVSKKKYLNKKSETNKKKTLQNFTSLTLS